MNLFTKGLLRFALKTAGVSGSYSLTDPQLGQLIGRLTGSGTTWAGRVVTEDTSMQIMAVWCCVRILAETIGSLPWQFYEQQKNGDVTPIEYDLTPVLMGSPNADMTDVEFREAKVVNLALRGNGYSHKTLRLDGSISALYPMRAQDTVVKRTDVGEIYYEFNDRGKWIRFARDEVWHVKGFGADGLIGYSPIAYARQSLGLAAAAEEFQARFFAQGARPSMIASIPQWLKDDQRENARKALQTIWSGLDNAHKLQLLEGGIKVDPVTMPLEDAQFLELRGLSIEEICRIYRMPQHLVQKLDRSTNNNIEQQSLEFVMYTLQPWLTRIEKSASRWLIRPADRGRIFLRFNVEGLLRADAKARAELEASQVNNGIRTRNEIRAIEKLPRSDKPGMDDFTVQIALAPIDLLRAIATRISAPTSPGQAGKTAASADEEKAVGDLFALLQRMSAKEQETR